MKRIWVRPSILSIDGPEFEQWIAANPHDTHYDRGIWLYGSTRMLTAHEQGGRNILHMPVQTCYVLESLGLNPEASEPSRAIALKEVASILSYEARKNGIGEMYFLCSDDSTTKLAISHIAEPVNIALYRIKIPALEQHHDDQSVPQGSNRPKDQSDPVRR